MVESNAGGNDELQRGEAAEDVGGDGGAAGGEYGLNGMGVGSEEKRNGKRRFPCLEQLEFGGKPARESCGEGSGPRRFHGCLRGDSPDHSP